jgi:PAS domain-containing protein
VAALRRAQALSEHYLRRSNEERLRLSALLDVVRAGILFMDPDHRVVLQPGFLRDLGPASSKSLVGMRDVMLQRMVMDLLAEPEVFLKHLKDVVESRSRASLWSSSSGRPRADQLVPSGAGAGGPRAIGRIWVFEDVTAQRLAAASSSRWPSATR